MLLGHRAGARARPPMRISRWAWHSA
jgi:hypothetical protein